MECVQLNGALKIRSSISWQSAPRQTTWIAWYGVPSRALHPWTQKRRSSQGTSKGAETRIWLASGWCGLMSTLRPSG